MWAMMMRKIMRTGRVTAPVCPVQAAASAPYAPRAGAEGLGRSLEEKVRRALGRSLHIRHLDAGSCNGCDWEMNALLNPIYDLQRFGVDFVASPRHADMVTVTGPVTRNLQEAVLRAVEAAPRPCLVVAVGACACGGGPFRDSYATAGGVDRVLPVDVYIPGCPPRPRT